MMLNTKDDVNFDSSRCDPLFADDFSSNNLNNWTVVNVTGYQINLGNLSTSIYFVKVQGETGVNTFKLRVR